MKIIEIMRRIVLTYDAKHNQERFKPAFICTSIDTRNRYKNDRYKIPNDKPQCPVFEDNRCCGGCQLAKRCNHCVDCGCYGFTKATLGGVEVEMTHKASKYYGYSRLKADGSFDWDYYTKKSSYRK